MTSTPYAEVIGDPIAQSKSPVIHGFWLARLGLDAAYRKTHVTAEGLADFFASRRDDPAWRGCNITAPHKVASLDHVPDPGGVRDTIGAINTVFRDADGALIGTNTDAAGFYAPIAEFDLEGAPVAVVGGPLRTGRSSAIDRVIRIQQSPHGALTGGALIDPNGHALGIITAMAIRGTTVVIPAALAWAAANTVATEGGAKQGFLGVSSLPVPLPERQRTGRAQSSGLLISHVAAGSPAESGGLLVGDVIVGFGGEAIEDAESLVNRLRGKAVGADVPVTVIRGTTAVDVTVAVRERQRIRA